MEKIKVNIISDIPGFLKGQIVKVAVNSRGTPLQRFWRRRFSDAKTDNCIEIVAATEPMLAIVPREATKPKSKRTTSKKQENST